MYDRDRKKHLPVTLRNSCHLDEPMDPEKERSVRSEYMDHLNSGESGSFDHDQRLHRRLGDSAANPVRHEGFFVTYEKHFNEGYPGWPVVER